MSESGSDINIVAGNYDGKGYDMSYKGYTPKAGLFYFEGKLQGYNYTFLFEKGSHTLKSVVSLAEGFVNGLMRDGVNMYDDEAYYGDNYEFSAHSKGRKITVTANDLGESQDYIMMTILITVN